MLMATGHYTRILCFNGTIKKKIPAVKLELIRFDFRLDAHKSIGYFICVFFCFYFASHKQIKRGSIYL